MDKEIRTYIADLETREENEYGVIEGRPIVFNQRANLGWFDEIIMPEALDECDMTDVRLCLNHDTSYVYARSRNNNENSTMKLGNDELGLYFRAALGIKDSPRAQDYYSAVNRKDIDKMSFMFIVSRDEWQDVDSDHPTRLIRGIKRILEISAVTFPAYDGTSISARAEGEALDSAKASLESARAKLAEERAAAKEAERREAALAILKGGKVNV